MKANEKKTYKVLIEQMTPVYTMVTVTATDEEDAAARAIDRATEEGHEWSHDRLPGHEVWSLIPPVDIFMPAEDSELRVLGVLEGDVDTAGLTCRGSAIVTGDGLIVPPNSWSPGWRKRFLPRRTLYERDDEQAKA